MACGCPNNCDYNVGDSCKWKESVAFDEVVVSGRECSSYRANQRVLINCFVDCILDGYGRKICSK